MRGSGGAGDAATPGSEIDVIGLAAQRLALERDPDALPGLLFDLVRRHAAAERGLLLWRTDAGQWQPAAGFDEQGGWVDFALDAAAAADRAALMPPSVRAVTASSSGTVSSTTASEW